MALKNFAVEVAELPMNHFNPEPNKPKLGEFNHFSPGHDLNKINAIDAEHKNHIDDLYGCTTGAGTTQVSPVSQMMSYRDDATNTSVKNLSQVTNSTDDNHQGHNNDIENNHEISSKNFTQLTNLTPLPPCMPYPMSMESILRYHQTCGRTFMNLTGPPPQSLNLNNELEQQDEKLFKCNVCHKSFNREIYLSQHMQTHTGTKPYECEVCKKMFATKSNRNIHMRIHSGERPYKCLSCEKAFKQISHLTQHTRIHTGEKPYSCDTCLRSFTQLSQLTQHKRIHSGERPFKCNSCGKTFTQRSQLTAHVRTHTGGKMPQIRMHTYAEKSHKCQTCGKTFVHVSSLAVHMRVHSEEQRVFKCQFCFQKFTCEITFLQHICMQFDSPGNDEQDISI